MSWLEKLLPSRIRLKAFQRKTIPDGLWLKCEHCQRTLYQPELTRHHGVCPCGHHFYMSANDRLQWLFDGQPFERLDTTLHSKDPLKFKDTKRYKDRLEHLQKTIHIKDAIRMAIGCLSPQQTVVTAVFEYAFVGGSMGIVVGESIARGVKIAIEKHCPFIVFSCSGGARMQEGTLALFQMAKVSAAIKQLKKARCPFISVLTHPTMGGVSASVAMLGDVIVAEPQALIGFAGPRVIAQTVNETLPEGFQRSEALLTQGAIDAIVARGDLRVFLQKTLRILQAYT
jgi:acetyl-CoA carboxylase carboxyl transferase subunit beta